jgi:hypothetical protein
MNFRDYISEDFEKLDKGAFHKWCIKQGFIDSMEDKIPEKAIEAGLKSEEEHVRKMAQFAKNMEK